MHDDIDINMDTILTRYNVIFIDFTPRKKWGAYVIFVI